jgi:hypothetical protein
MQREGDSPSTSAPDDDFVHAVETAIGVHLVETSVLSIPSTSEFRARGFRPPKPYDHEFVLVLVDDAAAAADIGMFPEGCEDAPCWVHTTPDNPAIGSYWTATTVYGRAKLNWITRQKVLPQAWFRTHEALSRVRGRWPTP